MPKFARAIAVVYRQMKEQLRLKSGNLWSGVRVYRREGEKDYFTLSLMNTIKETAEPSSD
jgi:hypothetical protein